MTQRNADLIFTAGACCPKVINGVTILGPDLFSRDANGMPLTPIASVFPEFGIVVTVQGIHAMHAAIAAEFLEAKLEKSAVVPGFEDKVYGDAVALLIRDATVLIRSDLENMDRIFHADELLQRVLSKESIQFTGVHLEEVREKLRRQGESWRISPPPRSVEEIVQYIRGSRVRVSTGATYYYNAPRGGRFLTYEEFTRIRPLIREEKEEALARLKEIHQLTRMINNQGARELSFFLPVGRSLSPDRLKDLIRVLEKAANRRDLEEAEGLFDDFASAFAAEAGLELIVDGDSAVAWRTSMFCRLFDIDEQIMEEWALGLSPEFHLNVKWLPGACISGGEVHFDSNVEPRVRNLISHFWQTWPGITSINVGLIESSQTNRERADENREIYLAVLGRSDGSEDIRHLRMVKWDVMHRVARGVPQNQAILETVQYRQYVYDRLRASSELGIPIPSFNEIRFVEDAPGLGPIPVFFFDRQYFPGLATDKIPPARYAEPDFIIRLARFLGEAAAVGLSLGRASPRSGHVFYDDGDEVLQLGPHGLPERLIMVETTGSFTDWSTPMAKMLPHCLEHLAEHLRKAREKRVQGRRLKDAVGAFQEALIYEINRLRQLVRDRSARLHSLFDDRAPEPGGIRARWEGVLQRLESVDTEELGRVIAESARLQEMVREDMARR